MNILYNVVLPIAKVATSNTGIYVAKGIVTDGAPDSIAFDLQTTFTICPTADKSQIWNIVVDKLR